MELARSSSSHRGIGGLLDSAAGLLIIELLIESSGMDKFGMIALFHQSSLVEDKDAIGIGRARKPVGDADGGSASGGSGQCFLYLRFRVWVESARSFIKDQNSWISKQRPRNRQPLPLAPTHADPPFSENCVEARRQAADVLIELGGLRRRRYICVGRAWSPDCNVVPHGGVEEECVLEHDTDLVSQ